MVFKYSEQFLELPQGEDEETFRILAEIRDFMRSNYDTELSVGNEVCVTRGSSHGFGYWDAIVTDTMYSFRWFMREAPSEERKKWTRNFLQKSHRSFRGTQNSNSSVNWRLEKIAEYKLQILFMVLVGRPWEELDEEKEMEKQVIILSGL